MSEEDCLPKRRCGVSLHVWSFDFRHSKNIVTVEVPNFLFLFDSRLKPFGLCLKKLEDWFAQISAPLCREDRNARFSIQFRHQMFHYSFGGCETVGQSRSQILPVGFNSGKIDAFEEFSKGCLSRRRLVLGIAYIPNPFDGIRQGLGTRFDRFLLTNQIVQLLFDICEHKLICLFLGLPFRLGYRPPSRENSAGRCAPPTPRTNPSTPTLAYDFVTSQSVAGVVQKHPGNDKRYRYCGSDCEPNSRLFHSETNTTLWLSRGVAA